MVKKPVIIAICGKSATGKDTLASWLSSVLRVMGTSTNIIVNDTTRSPRLFEKDGVDYHFLTEDEFHRKIDNDEYLNYDSFNNWFYGTDKKAILSDHINIGIFNFNGISHLIDYQSDFDVICVYLKCNFIQRLIRSYNREGKIKKEYFRRACTDYYDFKNIEELLKYFSSYLVFDSKRTSIISIVDLIIWKLRIKNFIS